MPVPRNPHLRPEREFGFVVGAVLCALGGWWLYRGRFPSVAPVALAVGAVLVLLAAAAPAALRIPRRLWMALAEALSFAMTRIVLAIVFFGLVTPIGLLRRAFGADPLRRRAAPAGSYWRPYAPRQRDVRHYEKMF